MRLLWPGCTFGHWLIGPRFESCSRSNYVILSTMCHCTLEKWFIGGKITELRCLLRSSSLVKDTLGKNVNPLTRSGSDPFLCYFPCLVWIFVCPYVLVWFIRPSWTQKYSAGFKPTLRIFSWLKACLHPWWIPNELRLVIHRWLQTLVINLQLSQMGIYHFVAFENLWLLIIFTSWTLTCNDDWCFSISAVVGFEWPRNQFLQQSGSTVHPVTQASSQLKTAASVLQVI